MVHSRIIFAVFALFVLVCRGQYFAISKYYTADCTGPVWQEKISQNECKSTGTPGEYSIYECSPTGGAVQKTCSDSACTTCTSNPIFACYNEAGRSTGYKCVAELPTPPPGSFVQITYENTLCSGPAETYYHVHSGECETGLNASTYRTCNQDNSITVYTCSNGQCGGCTSSQLNTGCTPVTCTDVGCSISTRCTNGTAPSTTGSATVSGTTTRVATVTGTTGTGTTATSGSSGATGTTGATGGTTGATGGTTGATGGTTGGQSTGSTGATGGTTGATGGSTGATTSRTTGTTGSTGSTADGTTGAASSVAVAATTLILSVTAVFLML